MSDELLDVHEAAAYLTVSRSTLYRLTKRKQLKWQKVGGATRFRRSELDRYLRANERAA